MAGAAALAQTLKAGLIAGVTAAAFFGVGEATNALAHYNPVGDMPAHIRPAFGTDVCAFNVAGHAAAGCLSSVASGGGCGTGALSGAVGSALSPLTTKVFQNPQENFGDRIGGTIVSGVAGGLASVAGGGKFANGAVTVAFGYLFNQSIGGQRPRFPQSGDPVGVFNAWHQAWVDFQVAGLTAMGYDVYTQVYFYNSTVTVYAIMDIVASKDGVPHLEWKSRRYRSIQAWAIRTSTNFTRPIRRSCPLRFGPEQQFLSE